MAKAARVTSIDVLQKVRADLLEYADDAQRALTSADAEIVRTIGWLRNERAAYWKAQIRKRQRELDLAKSELFRKELESPELKTSPVEERKRVEKAQRRIDEARDKAKAVTTWIRKLEHEYALYKGQCSQLASAVSADIPKAAAVLQLLTERLEAYLQIQAPTADGAAPAARVDFDRAEHDAPPPPETSA